jgi:hypothetical protein
VSQEDVIALLDRVASDDVLRTRLRMVGSADDLGAIAVSLGFDLGSTVSLDILTDAELDGFPPGASDRTCYGTTDCCQTKHTCFGTTDCCRR